MKTLKYILILILVLGTSHSCLVDDTTRYDQNATGKNLAGFELNRTSFSFVADGSEYNFTVKVRVVGPTVTDVKNNVTMTVAASDSSTAIEGVHYRIDEPTLTLDPDNNLLGLFPVTILTEGIVAPLDEAPVLVLMVTGATGDPSVTNHGKPIEITLNYGCFSNLAGTYDVHTVMTRTVSGAITTTDWTEEITQTGVGEYRTQWVTQTWGPGALAPGDDGFTFLDVCNVITVPEQNLGNLYSNLVYGNNLGSVDPVTGIIHIEYTATTTAAAGFRSCVSDYVPHVGK
jgi:hypothetical protein